MNGSEPHHDQDSEHAIGSSLLRWLALVASAVLTLFGIRLIERALRPTASAPTPSPSPSPPVAPPPVVPPKPPVPTRPRASRRKRPSASPIQHKTNGSVPPELADPPLTIVTPPKPSAAATDKPAKTATAVESADLDLDRVLEVLDKHSQRATYGAVAEVVGRLPINVMRGRDRTPRHSWVVSKKTGKPSNYQSAELHPQLTTNEHVIHDADELRAWLAEHG